MDEKKNKKNENNGSYMGVGMAIGTALGMLFGPMLFDSHATGIMLGMCFGVWA